MCVCVCVCVRVCACVRVVRVDARVCVYTRARCMFFGRSTCRSIVYFPNDESIVVHNDIIDRVCACAVCGVCNIMKLP